MCRKHQRPIRILRDRLHEGIGNLHRQVETAQRMLLALGLDEGNDVRMIAAQGRHHGATPRTGRQDRAAGGIPDVHEGNRAGGDAAGRMRDTAGRAQAGEVVTDAPTLLHGDRTFLEVVEDALHAVFQLAHHEAVEQRYTARGTGTRQDASAGQKAEILQRRQKLFLPVPGIQLDPGQGMRHPPPTVLQRPVVNHVAIRETVLGAPDVL